MSTVWIEVGAGLVLGGVIGWIGQRRGLLSRSGVAALVALSVLVFGLANWTWGGQVIVCVIGIGICASYRAVYKEQFGDRFRKGFGLTRDGLQVLAPLGWAGFLALLHHLAPANTWIAAAFVGALATTSADIWEVELGVLSSRAPRLITTGRQVIAGTPGAISTLGLVAGLTGAWLIGFLGLVLIVLRAWIDHRPWDRALLWLPLSATIGGITGSLVDSFLGATAQGMYYCERCEKQSERRLHSCGEKARQIRGWSWLNNEGVNFVSSAVGAAVTAGIMVWLAQTGL